MKEKFESALKMRVIPVVAIHDADNVIHLAEALIEGGLPCAEITFRTDVAAEAINKIANRADLIVGAGTVLNIEQVKQAVDNGACFIVSPGLNTKVVQYSLDRGIPVMPGICTPTDVGIAFEMGLCVVKFFPAEAYGGLNTLNAISAPFNKMQFVPSGGIGPQNLITYLKHPKVPACCGSWMVKSKLIAGKRFDKIVRLTKEAVSQAKKAGEQ
jgi:2-dehydro-3-deoxyphosphogluconate aldolase/(4S)-4-hydroxy-2-oxoglutarate aldolase